MPDPSLLQRLKERKLVQWAVAYLAGAWVVVQALDALETPLGLTAAIQRAILVIVIAGFFVTLVLAWYHGEKGRQRVSGPELLMVAALLAVAGVALSTLGRAEEPSLAASRVAPAHEEDDRPAIAVLPCENFSPNPDDAFFASGIHEEILLRLSKISSLRSIGRESVEWYRKNPIPLREMALELGVGFVGQCSVRKDLERNQIRLTFRLLDGDTGTQLWADNYDEDLSARSIFDIHSEVARQVAQTVGAVLTPEEQERIDASPTEELEAYELYLRGRYFWYRRTEQGLQTAISYFQQSIEADSGYAAAYAGLADSYSLMSDYGYLPHEDGYERGRAAALQSLEMELARGAYVRVICWAEQAVGYALAREIPGLSDHLELQVCIDPSLRRRGYGSLILGQFLSVLRSAGVHIVSSDVATLDSDLARFLIQAGFYREHDEWEMLLDDLQKLPDQALPAGFRMSTFPEARAIATFRRLYALSFAGLPSYQPYTSDEEVAQELSDASDLLFMQAEEGSIGFIWLRHADGQLGELEPLGLVATHQGRRLGRWLVLAGLHVLAERGYQRARVGVWADNERAIRLYQSLGFAHKTTRYYLAYDLV